MADAYKVKADTSFPRVIREVDNAWGEKVTETEGQAFAAGDYVFADELSPRDRERAESGDLDHLLEEADAEEAEKSRVGSETSTFIPDHEAEAYILEQYGHQVVPRDQVLELASAGADAAKEAIQEAHKDGADERPALTAREVPSLTEAANEGKSVVPDTPKDEQVDEDDLRGVEQPPGIAVGKDKAEAEGEQPKRSRPTRTAKDEHQAAAHSSHEKKDKSE